MQNIEKYIEFIYNRNEVNIMPSTLRVNFSGLLKELSLPEYKSLWPIFEAVVNSIQSINELGDSYKGEISINAIRNQGSFSDVHNAPYSDFEITDNGPGFNEQNYNSFLEAYSSLKVAKGCKGLGRFLWLKAFEKVVIESVYIENDKCYKRQFEFSEDSFITPEENTVLIEKTDPYTKVRLVGYRKKYQKNCSVSVEPIAKKIIEHCMMYFISDNCPQIVLSDDIESININNYYEANIKDSLHQDKIEIQDQSFSIYHIQMRDNATRHELHLCASDREVESIDLSKKIHDLNAKLTDTDGNDYYYVGYITGEYLDTNVNSNRTAFYIIELKRPNRNNYSAKGKDNDPIEQVLRYVKLIREGKAKLANGRGFGNVENTPFYCYIIADLTSTLIDRADTLGYTKTPDGEGYFGYNPNRNAYIEIISYSKLLDDAKKSNQVLFDKLFNPKASEIKHHY